MYYLVVFVSIAIGVYTAWNLINKSIRSLSAAIPNKRTPSTRNITREATIACTNCRHYYSGNPDFCPHCKTSLQD
ncbi:MAG: hypothetical protein LRZ99_03865 [Desulfotomaculum sp.]|nr:hypothetical protein [Desulfotomaculum sp.]